MKNPLTRTRKELVLNLLNSKGKYYPNYYLNSYSSWKKGANKALLLEDILIALKLKKGKHFITGNDAPRGGYTGNFVKLLPLGKKLKVIKELNQPTK